MPETLWQPSDGEIVAGRPAKNPLDPRRPYSMLVEPERTAEGQVEDVATIFLTNRECPLRCLMCDLWKNTTDETVPVGAIPEQIDYALAKLPPAAHIKLYNSGNFFDPRAIPPADHGPIADRVGGFRTVVVENHPRFCGDACPRFRDLIGTRLEVAIGLETAHPETLARLNKRMTLADFETAVAFLRSHDITVRTFILLKPPFMQEEEGVEWALKSIAYAFDLDIGCCAVIPTRGGNGVMERLELAGQFSPPRLSSMERVLAAALPAARGRVFMDLWDVERFYECPRCGPARADRLRRMNLSQRVLPAISCDCEGSA